MSGHGLHSLEEKQGSRAGSHFLQGRNFMSLQIWHLQCDCLVQLGGLEPPTFGATIRRSNQLSYSCMPPGGQCDNAPAPDLNRPDLALTSPNRPARSSRGLPLREHRAEALRNPLVSAKESVTL